MSDEGRSSLIAITFNFRTKELGKGLGRGEMRKIFISFIFKDYNYLFLKRGREEEREGEKHRCVVVPCTPPTGDLAHNPGMCPNGN